MPAELKRLQDIANKEFDEALEKVIKQGRRYTATLESQAAFRKKYDDKISSLQSEMFRYGEQSPRYNEAQKEINETYDHISKFEGSSRNELKRVIEDEKVYFAQGAEEKHLLSFATGFLILDSDTLQFDRAKVAATFGVYADTAQEVALLDKLKQLAALTNEIFGKEYPGAQVAFSAFFEMENGKVILSKNIKKETLSEYAKNM